MPSNSLAMLHGEIGRLRTLYAAARHAFREVAESADAAVLAGDVKKYMPIVINPTSDIAAVTLPSVEMFRSRLRNQFPRYLREVLFVRLISAFEVFLIDTIREVFVARRDLFQSNQRVEFAVGEILAVDSVTDLWNKVISRELRKLQTQGFTEVIRYYRNRLGLPIDTSPFPFGYYEEIHERRHLLVHRLGRTDDEYRHRYNVTAKNVEIDERELVESFERIYAFADFVYRHALKLTGGRPDKSVKPSSEVRMMIRLELGPGAPDMTARDYMFRVEDEVVRLADILETRTVLVSSIRLLLAGPRHTVRAYLAALRRHKRQGHLTIHEVIARRSDRAAGLQPGLLDAIVEWLPPLPWKGGIHREVATAFAISKADAWDVIAYILDDTKLRAKLKTRL